MNNISTKSLNVSDVPNLKSSIKKINEFALTYYTSENGDEVLKYNIGSDFEVLTVSILRYILYCEQRRWNHFGKDYDEYTEERIRLLIFCIRKKIGGG